MSWSRGLRRNTASSISDGGGTFGEDTGQHRAKFGQLPICSGNPILES